MKNGTVYSFLAFLALLLLTAGVYWPGLSGGFLFDDYENLKILANVSPSPGLMELWGVAQAQVAGMTRLLPSLSFAFQADAWPDDAGRMIRFNLLLHAFAGGCVYFLALLLARLRDPHLAPWVALGTAAFWLLNPLQATSVLYVVQRANQMSALFVFLGLLAYLHGRLRVGGWGVGYFWMTLGLVGGGGLAVLSKENGVLLPLLVLVLEATWLRGQSFPPGWRSWRRVFLYLPLLLTGGYLLWYFPPWVAETYAQRDFGSLARLLTETQVLSDYLFHAVLPRAAGLGLFHDDYPVLGWPPTGSQLVGMIVTLGLLMGGVAFRKRYPVASFGVLWFFAGHALESTLLPLELYFEHRNYLPLFGPALTIAYALVAGLERSSRFLRWWGGGFVLCWLALTAGITHGQARLWGNPPVLAAVVAMDHPDSPRAQVFQAAMLQYLGLRDGTAELLERVTEGSLKRPEHYAAWLYMACDGKTRRPDVERAVQAFRQVRFAHDPVNNLAQLADALEDAQCPTVQAAEGGRLVAALLENPRYGFVRHRLYTLEGRFLALEGEWQDAMASFRRAYALSGNVELLFLEVKALVAQNRLGEAARRLDNIARLVQHGPMKLRRYQIDVDFWNERLRQAHEH